MSKHDLIFNPPVMNAAGCLGFAPDLHGSLDLTQLGAFVSNPVSLAPRTPARGQRFSAYPGGFLLHTGFPNPGLAYVLRRYARHWSTSPLPVIVHLVAGSAGDLAKMARRLETVEGVSAIELGFSSDDPNGVLAAGVQAASGELPVIARLSFERCLEQSEVVVQAGASAVCMAPPRGTIRLESGTLIQGRMYGPAILPMTIRLVQELQSRGIPTIGAGGVYSNRDIQAVLAAGAMAVQLDSVIWKGAGALRHA